MTALALVFVGACQRLEETSVQNGPDAEKEGVELSVNATSGDALETKTALQSDGAIWWSPGDAINIFYGEANAGKFTSTLTEPSPSAVFNGTINVATGFSEGGLATNTFWGVYPYNEDNTCDGTGVTLTIPSTQKGVPGTFANNLNPSVANSSGLDLAFYNVGSWFIFTMSEEGITSLTFRGNDGEDIAGKVHVTMNSDGKPSAEVLDGYKSITITPEEGGTFEVGSEYRIVLLPQTFSSGFTLTLTKVGETADFVFGNSIEFERSKSKRKRNADANLTWNPDYVEMAEGFKWARRNVGAATPEACGDYFAWGKTEPNIHYSWINYDYTLPFSDAATANWGDGWRTPTAAEFDALLNTDNYTWEWTTENGVEGYRVTSKVSGYAGNSIFLPAAGNLNFEQNDYGYYWSSSLSATDSREAKLLFFSLSYSPKAAVTLRYVENTIRAIYDPSSGSQDPTVSVTGVSFDMENYAVVNRATTTLTANVSPADASIRDVMWVSSDPSVAVVGATGVVTGKNLGTTTITARTVDGGFTASCTVTVLPNASYVDIGNGTRWATRNVGADSPEGYGDYFAWGETSPKDSYTRDNYDSDLTFSDAATANLGINWRMPTADELSYLKDNCTWVRAEMNGHKGYIVNSAIFLPAAGTNGSPSSLSSGYYYSSEKGKYLYYSGNTISFQTNGASACYRGCSVRPIYDPQLFINGHEYVEMGDGLKWATMNVGASTPEDCGDYFAWGETTTKSDYEWNTYSDNPSGDGETFTKYATDKKTVLDLTDDAARQNWGSTWRMPTSAEWNALLNTDNFDWAWNDTSKGYTVTSKVEGYEGNSIFLPGDFVVYWSSTLSNLSSSAMYLYTSPSKVEISVYYRFRNQYVRPVSE